MVINGEIKSDDNKGRLDVGTGSILVGDVSADSIKIAGKGKGNIDIGKNITLSGSALVS